MIIKVNKNYITHKAKFVDTILDKSIGLIGNQKFDVIIFKTRFGIHTFGMTKPISVFILDNNNKIKIIKLVKPNRIFFWNPKYSQVLEFRNEVRIKVGDKVEIY